MVEFVDERGEHAFAGLACEPEKAHAENAGVGVWNDVRVAGEQGTEQSSRVGFLALHADQCRHHARLGAVGDHADDVQEQPLGLGQRFGALVFGKVHDPDMGWKALSLLGERVDLAVKLERFALVTLHSIVCGVLRCLCDPFVQAGEAGPGFADVLVQGAPGGIDDHGLGVERLQTLCGQRVKIELLAHVLEEVLLRPS